MSVGETVFTTDDRVQVEIQKYEIRLSQKSPTTAYTMCIFSETFLILIFMSMVIGWRKECDEYIQIIGHKDFSFKNIFGHSFVSVKTVTI